MKSLFIFLSFILCFLLISTSKSKTYNQPDNEFKEKFRMFLKKIINEEMEVKCHNKEDSSGKCAIEISETKEELYQCPKNKICNLNGTCVPFSYTGENCESENQCLFGACVNGKCKYLGEGEKCKNNRECGTDYYCTTTSSSSSKVCTKYVFEEKGNCETINCSPKFVCVKNSENVKNCILKGTEKDGEYVTNQYQCDSFFMNSENYCSRNYTEKELHNKKVSSYYKTLGWKSSDYQRLNARDSKYMGSSEILKEYIDDELKASLGSVSDDTFNCIRSVFYPTYITLAQLGNIDIEENDYKKLIDEVSVNNGLSGLAIFGIVVAVVAGIGLIGGLVYFCAFRKKRIEPEMPKGGDTLMGERF